MVGPRMGGRGNVPEDRVRSKEGRDPRRIGVEILNIWGIWGGGLGICYMRNGRRETDGFRWTGSSECSSLRNGKLSMFRKSTSSLLWITHRFPSTVPT